MRLRIMMTSAFAVIAALAFSIRTAGAGTFSTQAGQPICATLDDLHAYVLAGMMKDENAEWNCTLVKPGLALEVQEVISKSAIGDLIKAKVSDGGSSIVGYTMNVGLKPR